MWPLLLDMSKEECRRSLRSLELEAYGNAVSVLRAQGHLGPEKKKLLQDLAFALHIPIERHKGEVRKAVNDEKLNTIAEVLFGPNTGTEWAIEGRRLVPLIPREPPQTVFSLIADQAAYNATLENARLDPPSETASKASECPLIAQPASPEPSKTQIRSQSPAGIVMLPSGTAIQIKREIEDEERSIVTTSKRKRHDSLELQQMSPTPVNIKHGIITSSTQLPITSRTMTFPSGSTPLRIALPTSSSAARNLSTCSVAGLNTPKVIIVSSASSPGTSSILQKTLSVPIKSVVSNTSSGGKPTLVYTQSVPQQIISTGLTEGYKVRTKPLVASGSIPKPKTSAIVQSPQGIVIKNQPKQQQTPVYQSAVQTTKHTVPIQNMSGLQLKPGGGVGQQQTKILVQHKTLPRVMQKTIQHKGTHKSTAGGGGIQQQTHKSGQKQAMLTSVQVKTPQGYTNVPIQLRAGKQTSVHMKPESGVKMLAITAGAKILPKPSQPVYMVAANTSGLTVVTRSLTSSSSPRVVTVSTPSGGQVRTQQSNIFTTNKPLQGVHLMSSTPQRRQNLVLVQKGMSATSTPKHQTYTTASKDILGKVMMSKPGQNVATITVQKPQTTTTTIQSNTLAQSLHNLPMTHTQSGSVILLDLSSQESLSKNAAIAELLQASGIINESSLQEKPPATTTRLLTTTTTGSVGSMSEKTSAAVVTDEDDEDDDDEDEDEDDSGKNISNITNEDVNKSDDVDTTAAPTMSIEEAVEMLNKSDTPETRAFLSQAGIQISDEVGDSEEDDELVDGQVVQVTEPIVSKINNEKTDGVQLKTSGMFSTVSVPSTLSTTSRTMDIFSTALASANINLDNFMEEEDEPESMLVEVPTTETTSTTEQQQTRSDGGNISQDPIELQLAELTAGTNN